MTKYQKYFNDMAESHKDIFDKFKIIHDKYADNAQAHQKEFNGVGQELLEIIRRYENMLCSHSEGGKYGKYAANLAEKFWEPIRATFPKIDFVGVE